MIKSIEEMIIQWLFNPCSVSEAKLKAASTQLESLYNNSSSEKERSLLISLGLAVNYAYERCSERAELFLKLYQEENDGN